METTRYLASMIEPTASTAVAGAFTDEEAMEAVRQGDMRALAVLFDRYRSRLFAFLYRLTADRALAEDLLGETFLRIHQHRSGFRPGSAFAPWTYRIARNLAIQEIRHRQASRRADDRLQSEAASVPVELPEDTVERGQLREAVIAALSRLPEDQRTAAVLREYEGMSYAEVAAVLGCSEEAARARTYRARLALRSALAAQLREQER